MTATVYKYDCRSDNAQALFSERYRNLSGKPDGDGVYFEKVSAYDGDIYALCRKKENNDSAFLIRRYTDEGELIREYDAADISVFSNGINGFYMQNGYFIVDDASAGISAVFRLTEDHAERVLFEDGQKVVYSVGGIKPYQSGRCAYFAVEKESVGNCIYMIQPERERAVAFTVTADDGFQYICGSACDENGNLLLVLTDSVNRSAGRKAYYIPHAWIEAQLA